MTSLTVDITDISYIDPLSGIEGFAIKNPSQIQHAFDVGNNVGIKDSRRPVMAGEEVYESVVSLDSANCTGTIVDIEGYKTINDGTLIATAAHCVDDSDPNAIKIEGSFADDHGRKHVFSLQSSEVWIHPFHGDFNRNADPGVVDSRADIAIIYSEDKVPSAVLKAEFVPIDIDRQVYKEQQEEALKQGVEKKSTANSKVTVAGFSGDVVGLHTHENAKILGNGGSQIIVTDADTASGASGGPNYLEGKNGEPIALNDKGQPEVIAVNSAGDEQTLKNPNPDMASSTALKEEFLKTVPFLEKTDGSDVKMTGELNSGAGVGVNIRYGPGIDFGKLVKDEKGVPSALPDGSPITIHDTRKNHLGTEWSLVTGPNGRTGYVDSIYIQKIEPVTPQMDIKF